MKLRNITESDVDLLQSLANECGSLDIHTKYTYWVIATLFNEASYILEDEHGPIGFITSILKDKTCFIWQLGVLTEHRKKGYSHTLLNALYNYAISANVENIEVTIHPDNKTCLQAVHNFFKNKNLELKYASKIETGDIGEYVYRVCLND